MTLATQTLATGVAGRSGATAPTTASARWLVSLFAAVVLFQRISLPGNIVPFILPLILAWCFYGLGTGVLEFHTRRTKLFLVAAAATAGVALLQQEFLANPMISLTSWGLFMAVWIPGVLVLRDRSRIAVRQAFTGCVKVGVFLAIGAITMMVSQYAGLPYRDYLADIVPKSLLQIGYVITYPLQYGSPIYRANAWIGLEPSVVSFQLGVCLLMALLIGSSVPVLLTLATGMACTVSGSGIFVVVIGVAVMLLTPMRRRLVKHPIPIVVTIFLLLQTPMGKKIAGRVTEAAVGGSSTRLRAIDPYVELWPHWITHGWGSAIIGFGAGSSQRLITDTNRRGLLVPSPVKVFFDYGLIAGVALAVFLLFCYMGGPSRALAISLAASSWLLQPGTTTVVLAVPTLMFVAWWSPRLGRPLEHDPFTNRPDPVPLADAPPPPRRRALPAGGVK